jgi:hypothetical protein
VCVCEGAVRECVHRPRGATRGHTRCRRMLSHLGASVAIILTKGACTARAADSTWRRWSLRATRSPCGTWAVRAFVERETTYVSFAVNTVAAVCACGTWTEAAARRLRQDPSAVVSEGTRRAQQIDAQRSVVMFALAPFAPARPLHSRSFATVGHRARAICNCARPREQAALLPEHLGGDLRHRRQRQGEQSALRAFLSAGPSSWLAAHIPILASMPSDA